MSGVAMQNLTVPESDFLHHIGRWGSDGYPVKRLRSGKWVWDDFWGVKGAPIVYKSKRDCVAAIERYIDVLIDKHGGRLS